MKKDKRPVGAPPKFDRNEVMDRIYQILATSERGIADILMKEPNMPGITVFYEWLDADEQLAKKYARAKELQAEYSEGMLLQIADDSRNDFMETEKGDKFNGEHVARSKLRIEARQWLMGKLRPKKYGTEKQSIEHTGKDGGAIEHKDVSASDLAKKLSREELEQMAILAEKIQKNDT